MIGNHTTTSNLNKPIKSKIQKKIFPLLCFFILFLLAPEVYSQDLGITASVDKTELSLQDSIKLSITVSGVQNSPGLELPPLPDFRTQSTGTSSSVQIINRNMQASVTQTFRLTPTREGTFVIGSVKTQFKGNTYATDPITVVVKKGAAVNAKDSSIFAKAGISNKQPYVNEQVVFKIKLFRKIEARNLDIRMSYDNFRKEDLGKGGEHNQVINGIQYRVYEQSVALFPTRPGVLEIPSAILELDVVYRDRPNIPTDPYSFFKNDPFFGSVPRSEHKVLRTDPIRARVRPFPEQGKPDDFSGLVGHFNMTATLGKQTVEVGDSATLTVKITGEGNIKDAAAPDLKLPEDFKIYPDQPEFKQTTQGQKISGEKIFRFALVPLQAGQMTLPSLDFIYLDPEKVTYTNAKTKPIILQITPSGKKEEFKMVRPNVSDEGEPQKSVKIIGKDIFPIHTRLMDFADQRLTTGKKWLFLLGFIVPPLGFMFSAYYIQHRQRMKYDLAFSRNREAYKQAQNKLTQLSSDGKNDPREFVKALSQIVREYIGNKLNLQGTAFTAREVESKLREQRFMGDHAEATRRLLEKFEAFQFSSPTSNNAQTSRLLDESLTLLKKLEKQV